MGEIRPKKCEPRELTKDQLAAAHALAERLVLSAPLAVRAVKEVMRRGQSMPFTDASENAQARAHPQPISDAHL